MSNVTPSYQFLDVVKAAKDQSDSVRICEIGVDRGATTRRVMPLLSAGDTYDLFDLEDCALFSEMDRTPEAHAFTLNLFRNTRRSLDSYSWSIARLFQHLRAGGEPTMIYDASYLDGAHTFPVDAPTTAVLKEMTKIGGVIVFDDMDWTLAGSPTCNTDTMRQRFTEEQMTAAHVAMTVDVLVRPDTRFEEMPGSAHRAIFRRVS